MDNFVKSFSMKYKLLGNTGLRVSQLCLGTMTFGGKGWAQYIGKLGQEAVDAIVKRSVDAGINFIDTANVYSEGWSEELTGQAIKNLGLSRHQLVLATKVRGRWGRGRTTAGLRESISSGRWRKVCGGWERTISTSTRFTAMIS